MDLNIDLDILEVEPAAEYHAKADRFLSSHQLLDFVKCPWLHHKKTIGLLGDSDSASYLIGRAAHVRILEGRDAYTAAFALGGPINPQTGKPYGATTQAFRAWAEAQGKPVLSHEQVELIEQMASGVAMNNEAVDLLVDGCSEGVVRAEYCGTPCQIRIDWLNPHRGIVDLKTCDDLTWFEADAKRYGYPKQMAFYQAVLAQVLGGEMVPVHLIAIEKKEPFRCGVWRVTDDTLAIARQENEAAIDLSPAQVKAYRIADNATNEIAEWNYELLPIELSALQEMNFELGLLGFDQEELTRIMSGDVEQGLTDPDDVPAPPDEAITKPGDLWILGNHRLLCGDSGKPEDLDRLLDGATIHLVNTDPPYNVKVEPRSNNAIAAGLSSFQATNVKPQTHHQGLDLARHPEKAKPTQKKLRAKDRPLANDFVSDEAFDQMLSDWFGNIARVLAPGRGFYIWGGYANCSNYPPVLKRCELYFSQAIIWVKQHPVLTRKDNRGRRVERVPFAWRRGQVVAG